MSLADRLVLGVSFFLFAVRRASGSRFMPLSYELAIMGGRPFPLDCARDRLVAEKLRIARDLRFTQHGGQEWPPSRCAGLRPPYLTPLLTPTKVQIKAY
jgi:hypothetical protein